MFIMFVPDPPPVHYQWPKQFELPINDNGESSVNVFAQNVIVEPDLVMRVQGGSWPLEIVHDSRGLDGKLCPPNLFRYHLKALKPGDKIAIFIDGSQATNWLDVQTTAMASRACKHKPNIKYTSDQSAAKSKEWMDATDMAIEKILSNKVGKLILGAITDPVLIRFDTPTTGGAKTPMKPYVPGANKIEVIITPTDFPESKDPGGLYDETILHELLHHLETNKEHYENLHGFVFGEYDFFTITATNVYASKFYRPLRKDHASLTVIDRGYWYSAGEIKFNAEQSENLKHARANVSPSFYNALVMIDAEWNPFS